MNRALFVHYLLTLYRSLTRQRLYAAINVLGLAVGITVFLVLVLDVRFETGFERWIPDARRIYVLQTVGRGPNVAMGASNGTMGATLDELRGDYPNLVGTRVWNEAATIRQGERVTAERIEKVDPDFFAVFALPLLKGDRSTFLRAPDDLVLTQGKAKQYFGTSNAIGQRLSLTFNGAVHQYRVVGVLKDIPQNTDLHFDFIVPITPAMTDAQDQWRHWGGQQLVTYLSLESMTQARGLDSDLDAFIDRHAATDITPPPAHKSLGLHTFPLTSVHLRDPQQAATVGAIGLLGALTLLLAALNYVNLATARGGLRAREVAVRKVLGATQPILVAQFLSESLATTLAAALLGLALAELALPLVNTAGGLALKINYLGADSAFITILATALVLGLAAGAYPALVLSRYQPATVLASARDPGGGRAGARLRESLVVAQFAVAIAFAVASGIIVAQTSFVRKADIGFKRNGLIVVNAFDNTDLTAIQQASLLEAWRSLPGVASVSAADMAPGNEDNTSANGVKRPGRPGEPTAYLVTGAPDFFTTYRARLEAGRFLDRLHGGDDGQSSVSGGPPQVSTVERNVVLNTKAIALFGFHGAKDAIGKPLSLSTEGPNYDPLTIVGVIDDIRFRSPHSPVPPTIYFMTTRGFSNEVAAVRYVGSDPRAEMTAMAASWRRIAPTVPFGAKTIDDNLQRYYRPDDQHGRLFIAGAILALAIGCVGLYGLASFNTARRVKEIGIRKTLGASTSDVLRLLIGQFLRPVLLANLVAWPLAWWAMRGWLSGFDQRIALTPLYFVAATALTLVIALLTVTGQAFAVARAEPAKALRDE